MHVSPATRYRYVGAQEIEMPRWCATREGRMVFADTPLEAARMVLL